MYVKQTQQKQADIEQRHIKSVNKIFDERFSLLLSHTGDKKVPSVMYFQYKKWGEIDRTF